MVTELGLLAVTGLKSDALESSRLQERSTEGGNDVSPRLSSDVESFQDLKAYPQLAARRGFRMGTS